MDNIIFLTEPNAEYRDAFYEMVKEYENSGEEFYFNFYKKGIEDFDAYLQKQENNALGVDIPEGWVPCRTYWLVNNKKRLLGVIRVRTSLASDYVAKFIGNIGYDISPLSRGNGYGKAILALAIEKIKELKLDLEKLLITCARDNERSKKVIESNGGVFESEIFDPEEDVYLRRYWIELKTPCNGN